MSSEFDKPQMKALDTFLRRARSVRGGAAVYPAHCDVFRAFRLTPFDRVRVVILGQDPYYLSGHATGLAFSVPASLHRHPSSLRNITRAVQADTGIAPPQSGDLTRWAKDDGVLLLNRTLTVRAGAAGSHRGHGWAWFTRKAIQLLNGRAEPIVFLLWGAEAQKVARVIGDPHQVICAPHPASRRGEFRKYHPFADTNKFFARKGLEPISWRY